MITLSASYRIELGLLRCRQNLLNIHIYKTKKESILASANPQCTGSG